MKEEHPASSEAYNSDQINVANIEVVDLLKQIASGWKIILVSTAVCLAFALFHNRFGPTEYESTSILIQEADVSGTSVSIGGGSNLFDILSGGGVNTSGLPAAATGEAPPPLFLYPSIVNSYAFQHDLIHREVEFAHLDTTLSVFEYFTEYDQRSFRQKVYTFIIDYTIKLPFTLLDHVRDLLGAVADLFSGAEDETPITERTDNLEATDETDDRLLNYTGQEQGVMDNLRLRITLEIESGLIMVMMRLPDPRAVAILNAELLEQLEEYLTNYRTEKAYRHLRFIENEYEMARARYDSAATELANHVESNQNTTSEVARIQTNILQTFADIQSSIFRTYVQERERARLNVEKQTPVFQILDKPNIPSSPAEGYSNLILVFSVIIGVFIGIFWIFFGAAIRRFINRLRS